MGRPPKWLAMENASLGLSPLRQYWQMENRRDRLILAHERAKRKARDKKRKKCRCEAYPWPHRPGGGLCRCPDPPAERWQPKPGGRLYRKRYLGILRQIARANGMHPIRDRKVIEELMPSLLAGAKLLHQRCPRKWKFRNMKVEQEGGTIRLVCEYQTAGPKM